MPKLWPAAGAWPELGQSLAGAWPEPGRSLAGASGKKIQKRYILAGASNGRSHYDKLHSNVFESRKAWIHVGLRLINDNSYWN